LARGGSKRKKDGGGSKVGRLEKKCQKHADRRGKKAKVMKQLEGKIRNQRVACGFKKSEGGREGFVKGREGKCCTRKRFTRKGEKKSGKEEKTRGKGRRPNYLVRKKKGQPSSSKRKKG